LPISASDEGSLIRCPTEVAWVRVGVEEPGREDLMVVSLEELAGRFAAGVTGWRLQHRDPLDFLHHEQPAGGQFGVHAGHAEPVERRQHLPHPFDVRGFVPEVQFAQK
jgi:hypothetical protein